MICTGEPSDAYSIRCVCIPRRSCTEDERHPATVATSTAYHRGPRRRSIVAASRNRVNWLNWPVREPADVRRCRCAIEPACCVTRRPFSSSQIPYKSYYGGREATNCLTWEICQVFELKKKGETIDLILSIAIQRDAYGEIYLRQLEEFGRASAKNYLRN